MPIVPTRVQDLLQFADDHYNVWLTNAVNVGLLPAQATAFKTAATTARADFNTAMAAEQARKAATITSNASIRTLRTKAADTLALIKAFAENQANPNAVYALAQIPAPAAPSPAPPPGKPTDLIVTLMENGVLGLKWKCPNPVGTQGTIYEVLRKASPTSPFVFIGASGQRSFDDDGVFAGSTNLVYQITAVRSTLRGMPAQFNINFGIGGDGQMVANATPAKVGASGSVKMAA